MQYLSIINFGFVLFFGISLSLSFAGVKLKENHKQYALVFIGFGMIQISVYFILGEKFLFSSYPLLTHIPLFLLLKFYYKKNHYLAGISVLSAYLFCTPRKWIGTVASFFWNYDASISYLVQILITLPLLAIIIRFISPYVVRLQFESNRILKLFISVPLIYYVLEYFLTVYTDLLYIGGAVIVELMDAAVVTVYFIFSIIYLKTLYEKKEIEVEQALFKVIADQSKSEVEALRKSHEQALIYRHDLRHHLKYISGCISENHPKEALSYISKICEELDNTSITRYSENESVNLILSSYAAKAAKKNIHSEIKVSTADFGRFTIPDLCSLLSNAFENAIRACENIPDPHKRFISLKVYSKHKKLCIDIRNSYLAEPVFHENFPISTEQGHGFGTKSMAHVVEKYGGVYEFTAEDGVFIFQAAA